MTQSKYYLPVLAGLFAALTAAGAFIQIPLGFTSITLQTMFTILAGLLLGAKWGAVSQIIYVALGLAGLPIFTKGGGPGYFLQPSMGFLLALIPAAFAAGYIAEKFENLRNSMPAGLAAKKLENSGVKQACDANASGSFSGKNSKSLGSASAAAACIAAEVITYLIGAPYMGFILNTQMGLGYSASQVLKAGCLIYLPGDLVKCIVVILVYGPVRKALKSAGLLPKHN